MSRATIPAGTVSLVRVMAAVKAAVVAVLVHVAGNTQTATAAMTVTVAHGPETLRQDRCSMKAAHNNATKAALGIVARQQHLTQ